MKSLLLLLALCGFAAPAFAYVDPGTGMLAIQGLIALLIGVLAFVRSPVLTVKRWWNQWRGKHNDHA